MAENAENTKTEEEEKIEKEEVSSPYSPSSTIVVKYFPLEYGGKFEEGEYHLDNYLYRITGLVGDRLFELIKKIKSKVLTCRPETAYRLENTLGVGTFFPTSMVFSFGNDVELPKTLWELVVRRCLESEEEVVDIDDLLLAWLLSEGF